MKKNYLNNFRRGLKALTLAMIAGFFALEASAQIIVSDPADRPDPSEVQFIGAEAEVTFSIDQTGGNFPAGTIFYLHTGFPLQEDNIIAQRSTAGTINFNWPTVPFPGNESVFISAATGSFEAEEIEIDQNDLSIVGNSSGLTMNGTGLRRITTQPINTDFPDEVILNLDLSTGGIPDRSPDPSNAIVVQFSTDGGATFNDMTDTNDDNQWLSGSGNSIEFILTSGQKSANTIFRIVQENSNSFVAGEEAWSVSNNINLEVGGIVISEDLPLGTFTIQAPSTQITAFNDGAGDPTTNYFAGQTVEIDATFTGAMDQVDEFSYTAVFRNGDNERFQLVGGTSANIDNNITVSGTIPADITLDGTWDVSIEAFTGAAATFGVSEEFSSNFPQPFNLGELTLVGGTQPSTSDPAIFTSDGDRFALTPEIDVQTVDNSSVSFNLSRTSSGLVPDGTEIVLEFTTNGINFDQIGDPVSLNADLSEDLVFGPLPAGSVSATTQFRIRQISNNGAGLSTWSLDDIEISTGGTIISESSFNANSSIIDVNAPTVVLDPVTVTDDLIFPGSTVSLTYNIISGAFPAGTTFDVVLDNGPFQFIVGNATAITPGDDQNHEVSITVPSLVGGNYDIFLRSIESEVESNEVIIPVYNTTLAITEITTTTGVTDGGLNVIFPGDEITVNYTVDGEVGAGAELMLEVRDYDQDENDNDGFVLVSSELGADGSITGTLSSTINYDDEGDEDPMIRIKVGSGVLAAAATEILQDANGDDIDNREYEEEVFDFSLTQGANPLNEDAFIGSSTRTAATLAFDFSLGGRVDLSLSNLGGFNGEPQNVYLQASVDDGANWVTFADEEYNNSGVSFNGEEIPQTLRSTATRIRFIYNMEGESAEFENILEINGITLTASRLVQGNVATRNISDQFRKPTVALENLDIFDFVVGEQFTIEYTTTGPFPANTAFAIVLNNTSNDFTTVIGESTATGNASVDVTMPSFAFEDNGSGAPLYNQIQIFAYNTAINPSFIADETIIVDEDEQFLVIEGVNEIDLPGNGRYIFDDEGDRSLLTQTFDLTVADGNSVTLNFDFEILGRNPTNNILTIPVLQVSIDAGATFQNIPVEENGLFGDGFLVRNDSYSVVIPSEFLTSETHFRWFQPLNLGEGNDGWTISGVSITLENGNEITTFYDELNSPRGANLAHPTIADQYLWEQANAETDPVFNGEAYSFNWTRLFETSDEFPANTRFDFVLFDNNEGEFVIDPSTDRPFITGTSTDVGTFEGNVPFFVVSGNYSVRLIASIEDEENGDYFFFGNEDGESFTTVGNLSVFLRAVRVSVVGDPNAIIYAGQDVTFDIELENDDENVIDTDGLTANLIAEFDGSFWLIAAQEGTADITTALPPFINEDTEFTVVLSEGGPIGTIGERIDINTLVNLEDEEGGFISRNPGLGPVSFPNESGRRFITTREFAVGELDDILLFQYDLTFDRLPNQLTADQLLIFEVSTDGGATYTSVQTFPEADAEEILDADSFQFEITEAMRTNPTTFRWRQEEANGFVQLENVEFSVAETLPFSTISTIVPISPQALLISSLGAEELCLEDIVSLNYEIRGRFGSENTVTVQYTSEENGSDPVSGFVFDLVEGDGTITFSLPSDILNVTNANDNVRFNLRAEDNESFSDLFPAGLNYIVDGVTSERSIEIVSPINRSTTFTVNDEEVCDNNPIILSIDAPVNYFTYQVLNAETNEPIGQPLTFNDNVGEETGNEIELGIFTETTELALQITSGSSTGNLSCNTLVSNFNDTVEILENFQLYRNNVNEANVIVEAGETLRVCEANATGVVLLSLGRVLADGSFDDSGFDNVEWFVNDLDNPIDGDGILGDDEDISISGNYFARVTDGDGGCSYLTESIAIEVIERLDQPTIELVSGDISGCDGVAEDVVLTVTEEFAFYLWSNNETTREITVSDEGVYTVQVSNVSFVGSNNSCASPESDGIRIERGFLPELAVSTTSNTTGRIGEGDTIDGCESLTLNVLADGSTNIGDATLRVLRGTDVVASSEQSQIVIRESGTYTVQWVNNNLNFDCEVTSVSFNVEISEQPTDVPALTSTGLLEFCDRDGEVTLTAPEGFSQYQWFRGTENISSATDGFEATSNTLTVTQSGNYSVQVGNAAGCFSPLSNIVEVTVRALPTIPNFNQFEAVCDEGSITFSFFGADLNRFVYQLINAETGEPSGDPVIGRDSELTLITSASVSEATDFYLEASYADGSGCPFSIPTNEVTGQPNSVRLEVLGANLTAVLSSFNTTRREIRWYRNDVQLVRRNDQLSITVTDGATYRVEVDYEGAGLCTATSNSVDLGGAPDAGRAGRLDGVSANLSPNPASSFINVDLAGNNFGNYRVLIMTMTGQVLISEDLDKQSEDFSRSIGIENLDRGIYNVQVIKGNELVSFRIIKQ